MEVLTKSQLSIYLSVPQFGFFLKNGLLVFFLIFGTMVDNWNILKLTELFFFQEKGPKWLQNRVYCFFFKIFVISFSCK